MTRNRILVGAALLTLIAALIYQRLADKQDIFAELKQGEPAAARFERLNGDYPSYKLWDESENFLGYAVITFSSGYGGNLSVLSIIGETGQIKRVHLLENHETPLYLKKVLDSGILSSIEQQNVEDSLGGVDVVSGATVTSKAIIASVQKGGGQIGNRELGLSIPETQAINMGWKDLVSIGLLLSAIAAAAWNARKFRPWLLALSVLFIGFLCNYSLTYGNFVGLLSGRLPVLTERPIWYIMVPGVLLITLVWGKNFYCHWLCPFGAVQEGVYHTLNLFKFSPSPGIRAKTGQLRWLMLWLAALLALIFNNGQIAGYEPFPVFFNGSGTTAQVIITLIAVVMAMAQMRFWCNGFCPVGLILNVAAQLKRKLKGKKLAKTGSGEPETAEPCKKCLNPDCAGKKEGLSKQDKFFAGVAVMVNLLIVIALLQAIILTL